MRQRSVWMRSIAEQREIHLEIQKSVYMQVSSGGFKERMHLQQSKLIKFLHYQNKEKPKFRENRRSKNKKCINTIVIGQFSLLSKLFPLLELFSSPLKSHSSSTYNPPDNSSQTFDRSWRSKKLFLVFQVLIIIVCIE